MVLNQWNKIKIVCGNHGDDYSNEMIIKDGKAGMSSFYSCPKYISIYAERGGKSCNNRMNTVDYERMLNYVMDEKYTDDGEVISVLGMTWTMRGIEFKVIDETKDLITISMKNKKAIER